MVRIYLCLLDQDLGAEKEKDHQQLIEIGTRYRNNFLVEHQQLLLINIFPFFQQKNLKLDSDPNTAKFRDPDPHTSMQIRYRYIAETSR